MTLRPLGIRDLQKTFITFLHLYIYVVACIIKRTRDVTHHVEFAVLVEHHRHGDRRDDTGGQREVGVDDRSVLVVARG